MYMNFCVFLYKYTHVHILADTLKFAEPTEVSMPDSESTHKLRQNGGVDVSTGAR